MGTMKYVKKVIRIKGAQGSALTLTVGSDFVVDTTLVIAAAIFNIIVARRAGHCQKSAARLNI
ncbi:hypothetical protein BX666DRAFT_2118495 [Dichotomocladium elegans]|nr:hypothetical protein BX666DRAFT_2118495 [Dichotomocladium elegans]